MCSIDTPMRPRTPEPCDAQLRHDTAMHITSLAHQLEAIFESVSVEDLARLAAVSTGFKTLSQVRFPAHPAPARVSAPCVGMNPRTSPLGRPPALPACPL